MNQERFARREQDEHFYFKDKPISRKNGRNSSSFLKVLVALLAVVGVVIYVMGGRDAFLKRDKRPLSAKDKQHAVKRAFIDSWSAYKSYAWGKDVYHPLTKSGENMGPAPLGWIIIDSLDTLKLMDLSKELDDAREWVDKELNYDMDYEVNTFETTIRMLGGLLSAYYLTEDPIYLEKATDLGERIVGAFDSQSGIPYASVNLKTGIGKRSHADMGASSTAEAATVQLEFRYLANLTGEYKYWFKAEKVMQVMANNNVQDGLVPIFIQPETGQFQGQLIRLGSRGDSYYEYLLKQYIQTSGREQIFKELYQKAASGIKEHLIHLSSPNKLTFIAELEHGIGGPISTKMDHLVCFAGGMFALGATNGLSVRDARLGQWTTSQEFDLRIAQELTRTCYETYSQTVTGLGPEIVFFNTRDDVTKDFFVKPQDSHNLQRPETVESLFILWRLTKNPIYREWGWNIFCSFEKWSKLPDGSGYDSLVSVNAIPPKHRNNMESFWLAETLKYLYLLFEDDDNVLPLTEVVFNTEAHPFPVFEPNVKFLRRWKSPT